MNTEKKFNPTFEKSTSRTSAEIKTAMQQLNSEYEIRSNGDHIWVEIDAQKKQYWSPMMHLQLEKSENETRIKGQFGENPLLWLVFLALKISSIGIFIISGIIAYLKFELAYNFNVQLFVMFGMVSVWFAIHLVSERYKRKGAKKRYGFHEFVNHIAG